MSTSRKNRDPGLFDAEFRLRKLDAIGDPLSRLSKWINWERFRPLLDKGFQNDEPAKDPGGRPPFDHVLRFKVLILVMTMSMGGLWIRCVGFVRAEAQIILKNLAYNMRRYCVLARI